MNSLGKFAERFRVPTQWQRTLYVMFFAQLITAVGFSSVFPFLPLFVTQLGTNTGLSIELLAGLVFSAQSFTMMLASPVWGVLADRYGRKLMVQRAMFGGAVLLLLMAFVRSAEELVALRAVQGLITGTIAASSALVAAAAPRERAGYAMGMLQVGLGGGLALGPFIGGAVADLFGYRAAFFVTAAFLLAAGLMVLLGVEEKFVPSETYSGFRAGFLSEWGQILAAPGVPLTYVIRFLNQLGRMMIVPVAPLFIQLLLARSEQVNTFTGVVVGVASATTTLSAIYLSRLSDRVGPRRVLITCLFLAGLFYLPQSQVTAGWQLLALQALVGVAMGGVIPTISALLAHYTRPGEEGAVYGMDNSINAAGRTAAPLLGASVAVWFGLRATFVATALIYLLAGALAAWRLPQPGAGNERPAPEARSKISASKR